MKMNHAKKSLNACLLLAAVSLLAACGKNGSHNSSGPPPTFFISGTVTGLSGTLVLTDNGTDDLVLNASGGFSFATSLVSGANYSVAVKTQPTSQNCVVANGSGAVASANIANITISCSINASVTANIVAQPTVVVGVPMAFDASASVSSSGLPMTYSWDFGDGAHGGVVKLSRAFAKAGNYGVTLTVMDSAGHIDTKTQSIVVTDVLSGPTVSVTMAIADLNNGPLAGVSASVVNGASSATSDDKGNVVLTVATDANVLIKLTKGGYADQFVPLNFPRGTGTDAYFQAHMIARESALTLSDAAIGGTLTGKDGVKLVLNPHSLVDAQGVAVSGAVQISMTPVNVTTNALGAFPGRFVGVTTDTVITDIVSYDSVEFALVQNGQRLQIAPGSTATIEIPSYPNTHVDGTSVVAGTTMPLWALDEYSGLWIQEGIGTVVASADSPTGVALRATVAHMSWWNMDHSIDSSYNPQPQCSDGTIGVPGDTDHLANETICNLLAQFDQSSDSTGSNFIARDKQIAAASSNPIKPGFGGTFTVPLKGGLAIRLPANQSMRLSGSAMNGTWLGHLIVNGKAGDTSAFVIPLFPVTQAPSDELITFPFDATRALDAGHTTRLRFTADGTKPVNIVFARGVGSTFAGQARLLQGSTVIASGDFGATAVTLSSSILSAGDYVIEISNTGTANATFSLQANYAHWSTQAPTIDGINRVLQTAFIYDSQGHLVLMDKEMYTPSGNAAVRNTRLVFRRLVGGSWVSAAGSIELGLYQSGSNSTALIGFALDRADRPAYVTENSDSQSYSVHQWDGAQWQGVGNAGSGQLSSTGATNSLTSPPVLRFDSHNKPIVAYWIRAGGQSFAGEVVIEKFDGTNWQAVGPDKGAQVLPPAAGSTWYAMELAANDQPFVAMGTVDGSCNAEPAHVLRYVDTPSPAWVGVGAAGGLLPAPITSGYSVVRAATLLIDASGNPTIAAGVCGPATGAFLNSGVETFRFDGLAWSASPAHTVNSTGYVFSYPAASTQFAALDNSGKAIMAWEEAASTNLGAHRRYYLQTANGATWRGLGTTDGMVDGLSYPAADMSTPYSQLRFARNSFGNMAVAYVQDASGGNTANTIGVAVYVP